MKIAKVACGLVPVLWVLATVSAFAQRVQFPSQVSPTVSPMAATVPPAVPAGPATAPAMVGPGPAATFDGTIQPPSVQWDPYATPGTAQPSLLPQDPYFQYGTPGAPLPPGGTFSTMTKLVQEVRLDYVWMPGDGAEEFGIHDAELSVTFAVPFFYNTETPLLVTPGFAMHYWNGPVSVGVPPVPDLPPHVFDGYLEGAWNPQATPWFGGELSFFVIEGDQQTMRDADRIESAGVPVVQVNTGNGCHLDSDMVNRALKKLNVSEDSILMIENVGNLVCPSLFDLGESLRLVIMSVTEGDDKPIKYPTMFHTSDICIINKTDLLPYVDFDLEKAKEYGLQVNHRLQFFELLLKTGEGMERWYEWLREQKASLGE